MNNENTNNNLIPKLRFPEFQNEKEWEKKKLGELLEFKNGINASKEQYGCLLYTSPSPRDLSTSRMPSSA